MAIVNTHYGFCAKGGALPKFTYTGEYNVRDDGVVELLTSGTLVFLSPAVIDIFCVGGGGAGGTSYSNYSVGCGGGAGGFTETAKRQTVSGTYTVTIGAGGEVKDTSSKSGPGSASSFGEIVSANGGEGGRNSESPDYGSRGGNGGSGGGGGGKTSSGVGGSDGSAGGNSDKPIVAPGGTGQGTTTREFGESAGKLYAGGGGGGNYATGQVYAGGEGGGGNGAYAKSVGSWNKATAGAANTGGGGGGGLGSPSGYAGNGGSGIVCFRVAA